MRRKVELDECCSREVVDLLTRTSRDRVTNFFAGRRDLEQRIKVTTDLVSRTRSLIRETDVLIRRLRGQDRD